MVKLIKYPARSHGLHTFVDSVMHACHRQRNLLPQVSADSYILAPFSGIKATITNFGAKERDTVVAQLKQGGAHYSPELFRHTTHLVGNRIGGNKYK